MPFSQALKAASRPDLFDGWTLDKKTTWTAPKAKAFWGTRKNVK